MTSTAVSCSCLSIRSPTHPMSILVSQKPATTLVTLWSISRWQVVCEQLESLVSYSEAPYTFGWYIPAICFILVLSRPGVLFQKRPTHVGHARPCARALVCRVHSRHSRFSTGQMHGRTASWPPSICLQSAEALALEAITFVRACMQASLTARRASWRSRLATTTLVASVNSLTLVATVPVRVRAGQLDGKESLVAVKVLNS